MKPKISIMPSLRLGGSNHSHLSFIRRGLDPPPVPRPLQGGGSTAPPRRSFIKVLLPKVGRREISYTTKLRLFVFAPLT